MRVAILNLTSGALSGGYRKYLEIVPRLLAQHAEISGIDLLGPSGVDYPVPAGASDWRWTAGPASRIRRIRQRLLALRPDVVFVPTARIVRTPFPTVVMVRNMEPLIAPFTGNSLVDGAKNVGRRFLARSGCHRADRVIAVSAFVADFLTKTWRVAPDKVGVVPHGVEPPLALEQCARPRAMSDRSFRTLFFTAGSIRPARGLEDALCALNVLVERGTDAGLLIGGRSSGDGGSYEAKLRRYAAEHGLDKRVEWLGEISRSEMGWCFQHCAAFVMTSRVEACPNTALEALSYGALCAATRNRPMPETFGDAATFYEAGDGVELANRLSVLLLADGAQRSAWRRRATQRSAEFSWQRSADETVNELRRAIDGHDNG